MLANNKLITEERNPSDLYPYSQLTLMYISCKLARYGMHGNGKMTNGSENDNT